MYEIDDLIEQNKGLVYSQLLKFYLVHDQEAESIAYWALYTAIKTYKKSENVLLSTYATVCIYNALGDYVRSLNKKRQLDLVSYNAPMTEGLEYGEILSSKESAEDVVIHDELVTKTKQAIKEIIEGTTNARHLEIIAIFVDNDYKVSATDIAKKIGVSQSYVSQALAEFKGKLKRRMEAYYRG